ncbi:hypothetical protein EVAR_19872_1 [Eumeta japonica]|uniref:Uncharacterized protein n=1 Tax=Eumeta variegata TaxID=151549 RepID=A0A4C1XMQ7_EUMVA|nr:hypothetical protein EVAR_19872_1 [Eumeta japonica]
MTLAPPEAAAWCGFPGSSPPSDPELDDTIRWECPKLNSVPLHADTVASALREDISTIMSILQVVRSAEVADLAAKFRKVNTVLIALGSSWTTRI